MPNGLSLSADQKANLNRAYEILMDELAVVQEDYSEAAARVTRLTEAINTIRNVLDA